MDTAADPLPRWCEQTCVVCPAQVLGPGGFDVVDAPSRQYAYDRRIGWRVDADGRAVCVHPFRVGLPPGRYASAGQPLPPLGDPAPQPSPAALELPDADASDDLEGWLVATLRAAQGRDLHAAVTWAERTACRRFAPAAVTAALRRVLSGELTGC